MVSVSNNKMCNI